LETGEQYYLEKSLLITEELLDFEASLWLPTGFIWNDHAVAARVLFLTRLIDAVMASKLVATDRAADLFTALDRSVRLLAKPTQFTYRTNHGIIQSLAVLHVALFSPGLPAVTEELDHVISRLKAQMEFFVSDDGVVLEHSAGYQEFGTELIANLVNYFNLSGRDVPEHWVTKLENAKRFLNHTRRPDGSLPRYGDTVGLPRVLTDNVPERENDLWLNEEFGYWSSWSSPNAHLFASWANFIGGAHKHADEMSIIFWLGGEEWWTAAGYWPFGYPFRLDAVGWTGNNAPHTKEELYSSDRRSDLVRWLTSADVELLHLRRSRPDGYVAERIIVADAESAWFVIDAPSGEVRTPSFSEWRTMHYVKLLPGSDNASFLLSSGRSAEKLNVSVALGPGSEAAWHSADEDSVVGWLGLDSRAYPTNTLVTQVPSDSWVLVAWRATRADASSMFANLIDWNDSSNWTISYLTDASRKTIEYRDDKLTIKRDGGKKKVFEPLQGSSDHLVRQDLEDRYLAMQARFERHVDLLQWRMKAFKYLSIIAITQGLILLGCVVYVRNAIARQVHFGSIVVWIIVGIWLHTSYFVP
jgi:hypothetical protein